MSVAYHAHHGQTDKNGVPYIFHPIHLADLAHNSDPSRRAGCDLPAEKLAAWADKYENATKILTDD